MRATGFHNTFFDQSIDKYDDVFMLGQYFQEDYRDIRLAVNEGYRTSMSMALLLDKVKCKRNYGDLNAALFLMDQALTGTRKGFFMRLVILKEGEDYMILEFMILRLLMNQI